jgi:hypothetical protein
MHATFNGDLLSTLKLILKKENGENKNRKKATKMIQYDKQFKKKTHTEMQVHFI